MVLTVGYAKPHAQSLSKTIVVARMHYLGPPNHNSNVFFSMKTHKLRP